jgi:hypothetical protein
MIKVRDKMAPWGTRNHVEQILFLIYSGNIVFGNFRLISKKVILLQYLTLKYLPRASKNQKFVQKFLSS